jgi:dynein heavy chain
VFFDSRLSFHEELAASVMPSDVANTQKDVDFLRIDCYNVAEGIASQAELWKVEYGNVLHTTSKKMLDAIQATIAKFQTEMDADPKDLDELKFVLSVIGDISDVSMNMELDYLDIAERYHTLQRYGIAVPADEMKDALGLKERWHTLWVDSRTKDLRLIDVKDQFREVTKEQAVTFQEECNIAHKKYLDKGPGSPNITLDEGLELLEEYHKTLHTMNSKKQELSNAENLFNLPVTIYPKLTELEEEIEKLSSIYRLYSEFKEFEEAQATTLWAELNVETLQEGITDLEKRCKKFNKELKERATFKKVEGVVLDFKESIPLIVNLKNDSMKPRHWETIMEFTGAKFEMNPKTLSLDNIFAMELNKFQSQVEEAVNEAVQENKIEIAIKEIETHWVKTNLELAKYTKDGSDRGFILRSADDIKLELEDHMLNLQTMSGSRFVLIFADKVKLWEKQLNTVSECLELWFVVQRKWMYLESIFIGAEDIRLQLPEEAKKFDAIDKAFKTMMKLTNDSPNVVKACNAEGRLEELGTLSERLDKCQKSLTDYLDTKRNAFARFYFISDDELLSVLGSSDPTSIQVHMLKLFDNVKSIGFGRGDKSIVSMTSCEKEGFKCVDPIPVEGAVEVWMTAVESEMKASLWFITKEAVFNYAKEERTDWICGKTLGMNTIVGSQIWWTWETEDVFRRVAQGNKYALKDLEAKLTGELSDMVVIVRKPLDKITRKKVNTLLVIDVHARDIIAAFVRESILNAKAFEWESQLRFYWDKDEDNCIIRQCTGSFQYGFEYMGLNGRLVITPLTDRCYMTLSQALTFKMGGSPAGPAGTGKTETVKDLAKSLALPCFVINCGEGLDFKAMGSTFAGLVQAGAWGCFDEFNRINIEVLSVVSAQLKGIQNALIYDSPTVEINGNTATVKRVNGFATSGVFITMNPGYAGRTELPDNLKALFRPVTMIVPDLQKIAENMLFSEGFDESKSLAKKMVVLYKLSKEQLSKQYHYDFGLRSMKTVLVMAGGLKRQFSEMSEDLVLMRILRDANMPKYIFEDEPLFLGLINDLFPGLDCPRVGYEDLNREISSDLAKNGYKCSDDAVHQEQVNKCVQMFETQIVRHTTMIVGPTGGGKSLVLKTLQAARLQAEGTSVKSWIINPKAQSINELYGVMDPTTRDWTDGVLSRIFRELNQPLPAGKENEMRWIIYDGDVDAVWVENMNSVMDDNRLLTLPNGERIKLQPHCAMICEVFDLQYASPATISRCGMVWVDPKNLGYQPYYERWVRTRCGDRVAVSAEHELEGANLTNLFDKYVVKSIDYVLKGLVDGVMGEKLTQVVGIGNIDLCKQLCSMLDAFLPEVGSEMSAGDVENIYLYCLMWGVGGQLISESRTKFDAFIKKISSESMPDKLLYDFYYDVEDHKWKNWSTRVLDYAEPSPFKFYQVIVPTTQSVLYTDMLERMAPLKPILFVGESGTAKTLTIDTYTDALPSEGYSKLTINMSSRTSSNDVQHNIESVVDKRTGSIYGPPSGKKLIVFIDDMNMPIVDVYGTQRPITLLLTLLSHGFFYDREKDLNQKTIKDLQYIAAMGPPGGGRNPVDPRFIARFNVYNLVEPAQDVLTSIYSAIIEQRTKEFSDDVKSVATKITGASLSLFKFIMEKLPPTPSKFHYIFNLRDLSRIYEGLCMATPEKFSTAGSFVRLWRNECSRVFLDRLATDADLKLVQSHVDKMIGDNFAGAAEEAKVEPMIFGDFECALGRIAEDLEDPQLYADMGDFGTIRKMFDEIMDNYNADNKPMTLVLFEMALSHLVRIMRCIKNPRGNALLIGIGGSGKQSLTKLATYTCGYTLFELTLSRGYGENEFREELKELYAKLVAGPVVFLFTDAHVVEEGFLEIINNMLTTGMQPALFANDEKDGMINRVRPLAKEAGCAETSDALWNFFVQLCRSRLHIILAMSPSGDKLRVRCRNFPGLISAAMIDWFFAWPEDALEKVATTFLGEEEGVLPEHKEHVIAHMVLTHMAVTDKAQDFREIMRRHYFVTPKNYLDFISNYRELLKLNGKKISVAIARLDGGLTKLVDAAEAVDRMSKELTEKKVIVDAKTKDVEALIEVITEKTTIATAAEKDANEKKAAAEISAAEIAVSKAEADEALGLAMPAVEAAAEALNNIKRDDLTELKMFKSPPPLVAKVCMMCTCMQPTGVKLEETWGDAQKMLGDSKLLDKLKSYPKDKIKDKMFKSAKKYKQDKDMNIENMTKVSLAAKGLLTWVEAILQYHEVAKNVEPLRNKVKAMEKAQAQTEAELASLTAQLTSLKGELAELNVGFEKANGELTSLTEQASMMEKRLKAASKLIDGLTGERTRWSADIEELGKGSERLVGDCLLGASFLSYTGAFNAGYRTELMYGTLDSDLRGRGVPLTVGFKVEALLTTDATVQGWQAQGLPADEHSMQNGILTTSGSRFPLCIDPQLQAVTWIKNTYADQKLTVKTLAESDFMKHLELAIQFGNPFLFENVDEELDPMLDPVLEKNVVVEGGGKIIKLGDKKITWDDSFRLFFTSKLANPAYTPEVMGKVSLINYGVTLEGLANQLLNVVVKHERPDLEEQYSTLVIEMSASAKMIVQLEDSLLKELSSSTGNILDNEELIATLDETKTKAVEIQGKLEEAQFTKTEINKARDVYKPAAKRGSILYFAASGLCTINSMYEVSLDSFLTQFVVALDNAKRDVVLDNRLRNLINSCTEYTYDYTCTGIFEKHKLTFAFRLCTMILEGDGKLDSVALNAFLKGDTSLDVPASKKPATAPWLSDKGWKDFVYLTTLHETFMAVMKDFTSMVDEFKTWYDLEAPEEAPLPGEAAKGLNGMQKLAVTRVFRADRCYNAVKIFVAGAMGEKFVQPPVLDYARIYKSSTALTPMVFILSPGADPQADIQALGDELGFVAPTKFRFIALGQGQGELAMQMLQAGYSKGYWVLLQNCHLLIKWLKVLDKKLELMKTPHKDFRLWLTTEPTPNFPLGILQRSLKVVTEPPDGLKLNMRSTLSKIDQQLLDDVPNEAFRPCVFVLTFLHAVVQERRKYGKIGWNVNYDFNESDFIVSRKLIALYLTKAWEDKDEVLPWGSLKYLIGDAMYGGRVSDDMDRRVLVTYLSEYMGDFLFDDCQKFFFSREGFDYCLPEDNDGLVENYTKFVERMPLTNSPAVFGLHPNAEIGYYNNATKGMWVDLISLQPRTGGGGEGMSREDLIAAVAKDVQSKVPILKLDIGTYDLMIIRAKLMDKNGGKPPTPCQVVLLQELERWNKLTMAMMSDLIQLQKALVGEIGMSDQLDQIGDALFNGFLPPPFRKLAPSTEKLLGSWILHFTRRHQQYERWIEEGEPACMWISGLHIPESYLTALVQTTCRKKNWPLDKSVYFTFVTDHVEDDKVGDKLEDGSYVSGLYLEGAAWDFERRCLRRQDPKVLVEQLPIMQVIPIEGSKLKLQGTFRTPVYVTQSRRNAAGVGLVFEADLANKDHPSLWVLQGVALCLNVDT